MFGRPVTERDFRLPEFRHADPDDFEFREDGKIVRKDRFVVGMGNIRRIVGVPADDFEIDAVVEAVRKLAEDALEWGEPRFAILAHEDEGQDEAVYDVRLDDGSLLVGVVLRKNVDDSFSWIWRGQSVDGVTKIRDHDDRDLSAGAGSDA